MSKILEVNSCWDCKKMGRNPVLGFGCKVTSEIFKHDYTETVSPNCPLKDSDAWKKELLEWIDEKQYSAMSESDWTDEMVVGVKDLKQKIQEM